MDIMIYRFSVYASEELQLMYVHTALYLFHKLLGLIIVTSSHVSDI